MFLHFVNLGLFLLFCQDAHEFLNFLLNELVDILEKEAQAKKSDHETSPPSDPVNVPENGLANGGKKEPLVTWVHKNFQVTASINLIFLSNKYLACGQT